MDKEWILYEDEDIIVCRKAAGIATQTARIGQADMVSEVINYLARKTQNTSPYAGIVHRLDQPVEGILVFARNKQSAAVLSRQIAKNQMEKYYYAVVCGHQFDRSGTLTDYLLKDGRTNTSRIVPPEMKGAKKAFLEYSILAEKICSGNRIALAKIRLHTGRHHQIRVQMSNAGMSLLGDYKYAGQEAVALSEQMHLKEIALCACSLSFCHPGTGKRMDFWIKPEGKSFQQEEFLDFYGM